MRQIVSGCLEITGIAVFAAGLALVAPWLGVAVAGVGLVAVGMAVDPPSRTRQGRDEV